MKSFYGAGFKNVNIRSGTFFENEWQCKWKLQFWKHGWGKGEWHSVRSKRSWSSGIIELVTFIAVFLTETIQLTTTAKTSQWSALKHGLTGTGKSWLITTGIC